MYMLLGLDKPFWALLWKVFIEFLSELLISSWNTQEMFNLMIIKETNRYTYTFSRKMIPADTCQCIQYVCTDVPYSQRMRNPLNL